MTSGILPFVFDHETNGVILLGEYAPVKHLEDYIRLPFAFALATHSI